MARKTPLPGDVRLAEVVGRVPPAWLGENHRDYAQGLHNLASQYHGLGDYPKALPLLEQAHELSKKLLGANHPDYAASLSYLAILYQDMGDYPKALPLYEQVRELVRKLLGENHPDYATTLNNLASIYQAKGDYPKALPLFEQARELRKKPHGENHPHYAESLNNLALLYQAKGDYPKALPLFEQARELSKKLQGENHPHYAATLHNLGGFYRDMGDYPKALSFSQQALALFLRFWQENIDSVGERQRLRLIDSVRYSLNDYLILTRQTQTAEEEIYPALLAWKGAVSSLQRSERQLREQPALQPLFAQLNSVRARLAKLVLDTPSPAQRDVWLRQLEELRDQKEKLEAELARTSKTFRNLHRPAPTLAELRQALPPDTVLIDFFSFNAGVLAQKQKVRIEWKAFLLAFIVQPDQGVQKVYLGSLNPIEEAVERWREAALQNNNRTLNAAAEQLKERLWQPLARHLGNPRTILISPDGPLARFPFAALPGKTPGSFLLEDLAIGYVTSGRQLVDLLQPADNLPAATGLLTLGGVDYGQRPGHNPFAALPGTLLEAARIRDLFQQRLGDQKSVLLSGTDASKSNLSTQINQRCRYLHLATHGFFESPARLAAMLAGVRDSDRDFSAEQRNRRDDVLTFLPLLKSGLVLSGANTAQGTDAILTAEEVADLDLRSTELVVLSACQTGLGNLTQGDGVLGLQRAFHAGGARTLVASLWSVNDAATSVLMEEFYSNLWHKDKPLSKLEALRQAQLFVLKHPERVKERFAELVKRGVPEEALRAPKGDAVLLAEGGKAEPGQPRRSPPAWWAAFLLSGDWQMERRR